MSASLAQRFAVSVLLLLALTAAAVSGRLCAADSSRCIEDIADACPAGWSAVTSTEAGTVQCASRRFERFPAQEISFFCSEASLAGRNAAAPHVVLGEASAASGADLGSLQQAIAAVSASDPGVAIDTYALAGAFVSPDEIQWFTSDRFASTNVTAAKVDADTTRFLQSDASAAAVAVGAPVGCVGYHASNGSLALIPCNVHDAETAQLPFVCIATATVLPEAQTTTAPPQATGTAPTPPTSTGSDDDSSTGDLETFAPAAYPCADGFQFNEFVGECTTVVETKSRGLDAAGTCRQEYFYALPLAVNSSSAAAAAKSTARRIGGEAPGAGVRRSVALAWTGGVYSGSVGAGAWADPASPSFAELPAGLWSAGEPARSFGCIAVIAATGKLRLLDCDDQLPTMCGYRPDGRTPPPPAAPRDTPAVTQTPPPTEPLPTLAFEPECLPGWTLSMQPPAVALDERERGIVHNAKCIQPMINVPASGVIANDVCAQLVSHQVVATKHALAGRPQELERLARSLGVDMSDVFAVSMATADEAMFITQLVMDTAVNRSNSGISIVIGAVTNAAGYGYWFDGHTDWNSAATTWAPGFPNDDVGRCVAIDAQGTWRNIPCAEPQPGVICEYILSQHRDDVPTPAPPPAPLKPVGSRLQALDGRTHLRVALGTVGAHKVTTDGGSLDGQHLFFSPSGDCPDDPDEVDRFIQARADALTAVSANGIVYPHYDRATRTGAVCTVVPARSPPIDKPRFTRSNVTFEVVASHVTAAQLASLRVDESNPNAPLAIERAIAPHGDPSSRLELSAGLTAQLWLFGPTEELVAARFADSLRCNAPAFVFGSSKIDLRRAAAATTFGATATASLEVADSVAVPLSTVDDETRPEVIAQPSAFHLCVSVDGDLFTATSVTGSAPARDIAIHAVSVVGSPSSSTTARGSALEVPEHSSPTLLLDGVGLAEGMVLRLSTDGTCAAPVQRGLLLGEDGSATFPEALDWDVPLSVSPAPSRAGEEGSTSSFIVTARLTNAHLRVRTTDGRVRKYGNVFASEFDAELAAAETVARFTLCLAASASAPFYSTGQALSVTRTTVRGLGGRGAASRVGQGFSGPLSIDGLSSPLVRPALQSMMVLFASRCTWEAATDSAYAEPLPVIPTDASPAVLVPPGYFNTSTARPLSVCLTPDAGRTWLKTATTFDVVPFVVMGVGRSFIDGQVGSPRPIVVDVAAGSQRLLPLAGVGLSTDLVAVLSTSSCRFRSAFDPARDSAANLTTVPVGSHVVDDTPSASLGGGSGFALIVSPGVSERLGGAQQQAGRGFDLCFVDRVSGNVFATEFALRFLRPVVVEVSAATHHHHRHADDAEALANGAIPYAFSGHVRLGGVGLDDADVVVAAATSQHGDDATAACNNNSRWVWPRSLPVKMTRRRPDPISGRGMWAVAVGERETALGDAAADANGQAVWCIRIAAAAGAAPHRFEPTGIAYAIAPMRFSAMHVHVAGLPEALSAPVVTRARLVTGRPAKVHLHGTGGAAVKDGLVFLSPFMATHGQMHGCGLAATVLSPESLVPVERGHFVLNEAAVSALAPGRYGMCFTAASRAEVVNGSRVTGAASFVQVGDLSLDVVVPRPFIVEAFNAYSDLAQSRPARSLRLEQGDAATIFVVGEDLQEGGAIRLSPFYPPRCDAAPADPLAVYMAVGNRAANLTLPPRDVALAKLPEDAVEQSDLSSNQQDVFMVAITPEQTAVAEGSYALCVAQANGQWALSHALRIEVANRYVESLAVRDDVASAPFTVEPATGTLRMTSGRPALRVDIGYEGRLPSFSTAAVIPEDAALNVDGSCPVTADSVAVIQRPNDGSPPYFVVPAIVAATAGSYRVCVDLALAGDYRPISAELAFPPAAFLANAAHSASKFGRLLVADPTITTIAAQTATGLVEQRTATTVDVTGWGLQQGMSVALLPAIAGFTCADIGRREPGAAVELQPRVDVSDITLAYVWIAESAAGSESRAARFTILPEMVDSTTAAALAALSSRAELGTAQLPDGSVIFQVCASYDGRAFFGTTHSDSTLLRVAAAPQPPIPPTVTSMSTRRCDGTWQTASVQSAALVQTRLCVPMSAEGQPLIEVRGARFAGEQQFALVRRTHGGSTSDGAEAESACAYGAVGAEGTTLLRIVSLSERADSAFLAVVGDLPTGDAVMDLCVREGSDADIRFAAPRAPSSSPGSPVLAHVRVSGEASLRPSQATPLVVVSVAGAVDAAVPAGWSGTVPIVVSARRSAVSAVGEDRSTAWLRLVDPAIGCAAVQSHERKYQLQLSPVTAELSDPADASLLNASFQMPRSDSTVGTPRPLVACVALSDEDPEVDEYSVMPVTVAFSSVRTVDGTVMFGGASIVEGRSVVLRLEGRGLGPMTQLRVEPMTAGGDSSTDGSSNAVHTPCRPAANSARCSVAANGVARCLLPVAAAGNTDSERVTYRMCLSSALVEGAWMLQRPVVVARRARITVLVPSATQTGASVAQGRDGAHVLRVTSGTGDVVLAARGEGLEATAIGFGCPQPSSNNSFTSTPTVVTELHTSASAGVWTFTLSESELATLVGRGPVDTCVVLNQEFHAQPSVRIDVVDSGAAQRAAPAVPWTFTRPGARQWDFGQDRDTQRCVMLMHTPASSMAVVPSATVAVGIAAHPATAFAVRGVGYFVSMCSTRARLNGATVTTNQTLATAQLVSQSSGADLLAVRTTPSAVGDVTPPHVSRVSAGVDDAVAGGIRLSWRLPSRPDVAYVPIRQGESALVHVTAEAPFRPVILRVVKGNPFGCSGDQASADIEVVDGVAVIPASFTTSAANVLAAWPPLQPSLPWHALAEATYSVCASIDGGASFTELTDVRVAVHATSATDAAPRHIRVPRHSRGLLHLDMYTGDGLLARGELSHRYPTLVIPKGQRWVTEGSLVLLSSSCDRSVEGIPTTVVATGGIALLSDEHTREAANGLKVCIRRRVVSSSSSNAGGGIARPSLTSGRFLEGFTTSGFLDSGLRFTVVDGQLEAAGDVLPMLVDDAAGVGAAWPVRVSARPESAQIMSLAQLRFGRPCESPLPGALGRPVRVLDPNGGGLMILHADGEQASPQALESASVGPGDAMSACIALPSEDEDGDGALNESPFFVALDFPVVPARRADLVARKPTRFARSQSRVETVRAIRSSSLILEKADVDVGALAAARAQTESVAWQGFVFRAPRDGSQMTEYRDPIGFIRDGALLIPRRNSAASPAAVELLRVPPAVGPQQVRRYPTGLSVGFAVPTLQWHGPSGDLTTVLAAQCGLHVRVSGTPLINDGELLLLRKPNSNGTSDDARGDGDLLVPVVARSEGVTEIVLPTSLTRRLDGAAIGASFTLSVLSTAADGASAVDNERAPRVAVFNRPTVHSFGDRMSGAISVDQGRAAAIPVAAAGLDALGNTAVPHDLRPSTTRVFTRFVMPGEASDDQDVCASLSLQKSEAPPSLLGRDGLVNRLFPVVGGFLHLSADGPMAASTWGLGLRGAVAVCFTSDGVQYHSATRPSSVTAPLLLSIDPPLLLGFEDEAQSGRVVTVLRMASSEEEGGEEEGERAGGGEGGERREAEREPDQFRIDPTANAQFREPLVSGPRGESVRPGAIVPPQYAHFRQGRTVVRQRRVSPFAQDQAVTSDELYAAVVELPNSDDADPASWCSQASTSASMRMRISRETGAMRVVFDSSEAEAQQRRTMKAASEEGEGARQPASSEGEGREAPRGEDADEQRRPEARGEEGEEEEGAEERIQEMVEHAANGYHVLCVSADGENYFAGTERHVRDLDPNTARAVPRPVFADLDAADLQEPCAVLTLLNAKNPAEAEAIVHHLLIDAFAVDRPDDDATALAAVGIQVDEATPGATYTAAVRPLGIADGHPRGVRRLLELLFNVTRTGGARDSGRVVAMAVITENGALIDHFDDGTLVKAADGFMELHVTRRSASRPIITVNPAARTVDRAEIFTHDAMSARGDVVTIRGFVHEAESQSALKTFLLLCLFPISVAVIVAHCIRTTCATSSLQLEHDDIVDEARDASAMGGGVHLSPLSASSHH